MTDARWHEHADADAMAEAVAAAVADIIKKALTARGRAVVALPGGRSPIAAFERLAVTTLDWSRVTLLPGDERLVAPDNMLSNQALIARHFAPTGAEVVPLAGFHASLDLVWLGMGRDGHTASIFPGADLDTALDLDGPDVVRVQPDPLPPEAPVPRLTLTRAAIAAARAHLLTLAGPAKRAVLEQAIDEGDGSAYPVGRVLAAIEAPVAIHWSAA